MDALIAIIATVMGLGIIAAIIILKPGRKQVRSKPQYPTPEEEATAPQSANDYPGVLWLLPVFFGLFGGIIAAVIAGTTYKSKSWGGLLAIGLLMSVVSMIIFYSIFQPDSPF